MNFEKATETYFCPTESGDYEFQYKDETIEHIPYTKQLGNALESEEMRQHCQEDGSYPANSLNNDVQDELERIRKAKDVESETMLAWKESYQYVLQQEEYETSQIAENMDVSENTVQARRGEIKRKIRVAEETAELGL